MSDHIATKKLIEYLRIKSVHPDPDYSKKNPTPNLFLNLISFTKRVLSNLFVNMPTRSVSTRTKRSRYIQITLFV